MPSTGVTITNTFQSQPGPIPLSQLDADFSELATVLNALSTYQNYYVDSGVVNSLVVQIPSPLVFSYTAGVALDVKVAVTNTGATVINVNGMGSQPVTDVDGTALLGGELIAGAVVRLFYDGTQFQLQSGKPLDTLPTTIPTDGWYLSAAHTVAAATNTTQRMTIGPNGNVAVNPPSSGVSLTATAVGANAAAALVGATSNGAWESFTDGNTGNRVWNVGVAVSIGVGIFEIRDSTRGATPLSISTTGAVSIASAASGIPLSVAGTGSLGIVTTAGAGAATSIGVAGNGTAFGTTSFDLVMDGASNAYVYNRSNGTLLLGTNNATRVSIGGGGNITCNAPTNGQTTLTIQSPANNPALNLAGVSGQTTPTIQVASLGSFPALSASAGSGIPAIGLYGDTLFGFGNNLTGANTLTPTWTNYPGGAGTKNPATWVKVITNNGLTTGYIPVFT